jgi:4-hydroxybenzoate polyprenyltransferase
VTEHPRSKLTGLIQACHPGPTAVVTLVISIMAFAAGRDLRGVILMGTAALTGQLSVGWSNDAHDAVRDQQAARTNKPTVRGQITASQLWMFAIAAVIMCVPLSFIAAGFRGGLAHLIAVASAWAYNFYFKTTRLSWLPYAISFGLIPAFVTYGLTPSHAPAVWLTAAASLMGVGAHLANALPDLESDASIDAGGAAVALGRRRTSFIAVGLLLTAIALLIAHVNLGSAISIAVVSISVVAIAAALRSRNDKILFAVTMGLALMAVVLLLISSISLAQ